MMLPVEVLPDVVADLLLHMEIEQSMVDIIATPKVIVGFAPAQREAGDCFCALYTQGEVATSFPDEELDHVSKTIPEGCLIIKGIVGQTAAVYGHPHDVAALIH